jgi:hypothetical protein
MKEGTVPVPLYCPCAESDDNVLPVQMVSHWGEHKVAGVKPPYAFKVLKKGIVPF